MHKTIYNLLPVQRGRETGELMQKLGFPREMWDHARRNGQTMADFHYWLMTYQIELWALMVLL